MRKISLVRSRLLMDGVHYNIVKRYPNINGFSEVTIAKPYDPPHISVRIPTSWLLNKNDNRSFKSSGSLFSPYPETNRYELPFS